MHWPTSGSTSRLIRWVVGMVPPFGYGPSGRGGRLDHSIVSESFVLPYLFHQDQLRSSFLYFTAICSSPTNPLTTDSLNSMPLDTWLTFGKNAGLIDPTVQLTGKKAMTRTDVHVSLPHSHSGRMHP